MENNPSPLRERLANLNEPLNQIGANLDLLGEGDSGDNRRGHPPHQVLLNARKRTLSQDFPLAAGRGVTPVNWQHLSISGLHFEYDDPRTKKHVLANISIEIGRGQRIAFVGPSGAGKSTLLKLLRGLYATTPLALKTGAQSFTTLEPLAPISMLIPQEPEIFENTIEYNLTIGVETAPEDIQRVIRCAALEQVVAELPHGLATDIREKGVNLSGGQKQRLALARGLLAAQNAELLLMDEPTSSVDPATEGLIFDRILAEYADKTLIVSLHRLHLLSRFDMIYVMEEGKIVQQGRFQQLVATEGLFKQLWQNYLMNTQ